MARPKDNPNVYYPAAKTAYGFGHRINWHEIEIITKQEIPMDYHGPIHDAVCRLTSWLEAGEKKLEIRDIEAIYKQLTRLEGTYLIMGLEKEFGALQERLSQLTKTNNETDKGSVWHREIAIIMRHLKCAGIPFVTTEGTENSKSIPVCQRVIRYILEHHTRGLSVVSVKNTNCGQDKKILSVTLNGDELVRNVVTVKDADKCVKTMIMDSTQKKARHLGSDKALAKAMIKAWKASSPIT